MSGLTPKLDEIASHGNRGHAAKLGAPADDSHIRCVDGSVLSVIAGGGTYSRPLPATCSCSFGKRAVSLPRYLGEVAHDYPGPYTHVEVMPVEGDWPAKWFDNDSVATVAVDDVRAEISKRGGEVDPLCRPHPSAPNAIRTAHTTRKD